jgi:hypothetical protein
MNDLMEMVNRGAQQLLGRASGPLHFRFLMMPTVVTVLVIRAGLKDASEGEPAFLWAFLTKPAARPRLLRSALEHIGRILIVALVLDTIYQLIVFKTFYPVQALIVAVACAVVPYVLFRGPVARVTRLLRKRSHGLGAAN